jgi:hypothetical protein
MVPLSLGSIRLGLNYSLWTNALAYFAGLFMTTTKMFYHLNPRRFPNSEFDRPGNFSTHMGKCTNTLLEIAAQIKDQQVITSPSIWISV